MRRKDSTDATIELEKCGALTVKSNRTQIVRQFFTPAQVEAQGTGLVDRRFKTMKRKSAAELRPFTEVMDHEAKNVQARAIPLGSYTETAAANALVLIGIGSLLVSMFSRLFAFGVP